MKAKNAIGTSIRELTAEEAALVAGGDDGASCGAVGDSGAIGCANSDGSVTATIGDVSVTFSDQNNFGFEAIAMTSQGITISCGVSVISDSTIGCSVVGNEASIAGGWVNDFTGAGA